MTTTEIDIAGPKAGKKERISPRIRQAIEAMVNGEARTQKAAAAMAGITAEHLCKELKKDKIRAFATRAIQNTLAAGQMRAVAVLNSIMETGLSEHARKDIAIHLLELGGHKVDRSTPTINITNTVVTPGYVLDLRSPEQIAAVEGKTIDHRPNE
jgi:hypothetical protein